MNNTVGYRFEHLITGCLKYGQLDTVKFLLDNETELFN